MSLTPLTIWVVAQMAGRQMPPLGRRGVCPFRKHRRGDRSVSVFMSKSGDTVLYKCHSCDPPYNIGDAVQLYAGLYGLDRRDAWRELRDRGYAVPGADESRPPRKEHKPRPAPPLPRKRHPVQGQDQGPVVPFSAERFSALAGQRLGATARLSAERRIALSCLRAHDVVDVDAHVVGFGYRHPMTGQVTRMKVRPLDRKIFWIEPKPPEGRDGKALGPLYLAHQLLRPEGGERVAVVITEGELDALSLRHWRFARVVSLPDGVGSASRVDVSPISFGYALWLVATDADPQGEEAFSVLRERAGDLGVRAARVVFERDGVLFKDANEAQQNGFTGDDFERCLQEATRGALGHALPLREETG